MTSVYEFKTTLTVSAGSTGVVATTLNVGWGTLQQFLVTALTSNATTFRANITDRNSIVRRRYGFSTGEINDLGVFLPLSGRVTFSITNASANDTFQLVAAFQE